MFLKIVMILNDESIWDLWEWLTIWDHDHHQHYYFYYYFYSSSPSTNNTVIKKDWEGMNGMPEKMVTAVR